MRGRGCDGGGSRGLVMERKGEGAREVRAGIGRDTVRWLLGSGTIVESR